MRPSEYGYKGDEQITITGKEFLLLREAIKDGIQASIDYRMDEVVKWVNQDGEDIENPTPEQIVNGEVRKATDIRATFSDENTKTYFDPRRLTNEMLLGQELMLDIHMRNINNQIAVHKDEVGGN
jgi:hypothetical protein